jgi:hypothetical protein
MKEGKDEGLIVTAAHIPHLQQLGQREHLEQVNHLDDLRRIFLTGHGLRSVQDPVCPSWQHKAEVQQHRSPKKYEVILRIRKTGNVMN